MMRHRHFTLIELLAAIGIVILLAGIVLGGMSFAMKKADVSKTIATMEAFQTALETFKADYGYYPVYDGDVDFSQDAWKLFINSTTNKRNRPYIEGYSPSDKLLDAWEQPLKYEYPAASGKKISKYALWSLGPDADKDADNICSWKQK